MTTGVEPHVPLAPRAPAVSRELATGTAETKSLLFPSPVGKPQSGMTYDMLLRRLGLAYTMHDFRSTVRD